METEGNRSCKYRVLQELPSGKAAVFVFALFEETTLSRWNKKRSRRSQVCSYEQVTDNKLIVLDELN